jgi:uncharacterized protein with GYD domain
VRLEYRPTPASRPAAHLAHSIRRELVARYLFQVSYTAEGSKGLLKDGGSKRKQAAKTLVESLNGKMEAFYFAFGTTDAYVIVDMPDNVSAASVSLATASSGAVTGHIVVLLTPEELDQAAKKSVNYTPPGR